MAIIRATAENIPTPPTRRTAIVPPSLAETKHVRDSLYGIINDYIDNDPRNLQKEIGPSEIGDPCEYCLGARLAGFKPKRNGDGWLTYIGSVVHNDLDANVLPGHVEWATAKRLFVGIIDGRRIEGTTDASYVADPFTVVDFKVVGKRTLDTVKFEEMKRVYRYQTQIYGLGYAIEGNPPLHAAVAFLPREERFIKRGYWWSEPYDEDVAVEALERASRIARDIRVLGWETVGPTLEQLDGCYNCARWDIPGEGD